jgi:hypothetical protein
MIYIIEGLTLATALHMAVEDFLHYLRADKVHLAEDVDALVKQALS